MNKKNNRKLLFAFFLVYMIVNLILVLRHEPWRDEIHAWFMAENMTIKELFIASRFDGHPILWHLILMPFAKLGFPIFTLQIINFLIVMLSAYLFLFKTNLNFKFKLFVLFTVPFMYIYPVIARNYCLILLFTIFLAIIYKKRYEKPLIYSFLICLLMNTPTMSWGLSLGLVLTFHIYEIYKKIRFKSVVKNFNRIVIGFLFIFLTFILLLFQLNGTSNPDFGPISIKQIYGAIPQIFNILIIILILVLVNIFFDRKRSKKKELIIVLCAFVTQIIIYSFFYGSVLEPRLILPSVFLLFYLIVNCENCEEKNKRIYYYMYIYLMIFTLFIFKTYKYAMWDFKNNYSSAQELSRYINENIDSDELILVRKSIICQSFFPYIDNEIYDIYYEKNVKEIHHMSYIQEKKDIDYSKYNGKYIVMISNVNNKNLKLVYKTSSSITGEVYYLYYIDYN